MQQPCTENYKTLLRDILKWATLRGSYSMFMGRKIQGRYSGNIFPKFDLCTQRIPSQNLSKLFL